MKRKFLLLSLLFFGALASAEEDQWQKLFSVNQRFAAAGSKEGEFKLAEMYEEGLGTPPDLEKARFWYEKAALQGHQEARQRVKNWNARQAERAREAEQAKLAGQMRAQEQARQDAQRRAEEEQRAQLEAQKHADEEKARLATQKRMQEQQVRAAAQKRGNEDVSHPAAQKRAPDRNPVHEASTSAEVPEVTTPVQPAPTHTTAAAAPPDAAGEKQAPESFETDPCKTPAAKFTSTCRGK